MKLSLCLIVKPTKEEAKLLDRCLSYVAPHVDEICVTQAGKAAIKEVSKVIAKYKGKESFFEWVGDFAKARNFNFSQATGDYILWLDSDDVLKGAEHLKETVTEMGKRKIDVGVMHYLYHFNSSCYCDTKHLKTRIVKNDGCVTWEGKVHEDFKQNRALDSFFIENIEVLHLTDEKRINQSAERNLDIARQALKNAPEDPRSYWLMGNALIMEQQPQEAAKHFDTFLELSQSDDEKYLVNLMLFDIRNDYRYALEAIYLRPSFPDAYLKLGDWLYNAKKYQNALNFLEIGLQLPVPDMEIIAYNPREYDLIPLMTMAKVHFETGKYQKAVEIIQRLKKMFPKEKMVVKLGKLIEKEMGEALEVDKYLQESEKIKDKEELRKYLDNLPEKVASHPKICYFRNELFRKESSSGKDLVYYCGYTSRYWNPDIADKEGIGGSEEAVINLSKRLASLGWNVTVYNNCKKEGEWDGVKYRYFWRYNVRDKQDVTILWRHPKPCDHEINSDRIFIDLHDVIDEAEFTRARLAKIDRIMVKTKAHRDLFPKIPDEKFAIIPNGVDPDQFDVKVERNPYLILNSSSPDRHLDATLDIFEELIKKQPDKPWKLAWYYGWGVYDSVHEGNKDMIDWKSRQMERFNNLVKQGRAEGGCMIGHKEIAKKYLEAGVFLYPTQFYEIHCISAVKAQLAGCYPVTSDFAALDESVQYGAKKHTDGAKWLNSTTFGDDDNIEEYVYQIMHQKEFNQSEAKVWATQTYDWYKIANNWNKIIC